jgi:hypothetical protein
MTRFERDTNNHKNRQPFIHSNSPISQISGDYPQKKYGQRHRRQDDGDADNLPATRRDVNAVADGRLILDNTRYSS